MIVTPWRLDLTFHVIMMIVANVASAMNVVVNSHNKRVSCTNEHLDRGVCLSKSNCTQELGMDIGPCGNGEDQVCCFLDLPCQRRDRLNNMDSRTILELSKAGLRDPPVHEILEPLQRLNRQQRSTPPEPLFEPMTFPCGMPNGAGRQANILNSKIASEPNPWLLALWVRFKFGSFESPVCGATLVTAEYALTAAHCVQRQDFSFFVIGGTNVNDGKSGILKKVEFVVTHPQFDKVSLEYDIAVLKLEKPFVLSSTLYPACLPAPVEPESKEMTDYSGHTVSVAGWGCLKENCDLHEVPTLARIANMTVITNDLAMCWWGWLPKANLLTHDIKFYTRFRADSVNAGRSEYVPKRLFVVGGDESGTTSPCRGDSGSPVVWETADKRIEVIGLISWSKGCGRPFRPSVWTRLESFTDWIVGIINEKDLTIFKERRREVLNFIGLRQPVSDLF